MCPNLETPAIVRPTLYHINYARQGWTRWANPNPVKMSTSESLLPIDPSSQMAPFPCFSNIFNTPILETLENISTKIWDLNREMERRR